jgi:hypothetical protein
MNAERYNEIQTTVIDFSRFVALMYSEDVAESVRDASREYMYHVTMRGELPGKHLEREIKS